MSWVQLDHTQVMLPGPVIVAEGTGVKVTEPEVDPSFGGMPCEEFFEFIGGVPRVTSEFECDREVKAGLKGVGFEGQSSFVSGQGGGEIAIFVGGNPEIVIGIETGCIGSRGLLVQVDGLGQPVPVMELDSFGHQSFGRAAVAWSEHTDRAITISRET
jgi:hypothetical protein